MKVNQAEIIISAVSKAQYPADNLPEIVLLGRSNVGKSSFINALIKRKSLARTSSSPGKTQTMNFYRINEQFYFVDMPGYGYAKVSKREREKWGVMIEEYLKTRKNIVSVFLLVDSRHQPSEDDILMYDWLIYAGINPVIIATKADKLSRNDIKKSMARITKIMNSHKNQEIVLFSTQSKAGYDEAWDYIEAVL